MKLKKPKFWDYKKPNFFAYILKPVSFIIEIINSFKKKPLFKNEEIKTICVGNIYIGGTGKTSLSILINEILIKKGIKSCFIKKFYSDQIDEQRLLENKGKLFSSYKRKEALDQAIKEGYEVAIFDDGLQDDSILFDLSFVCFNNLNWIGNGLSIPAGPLRENLNKLKEYQHVVLNGNVENIEYIEKKILNINPKINIHIGEYIPLNLNEFNKQDNYLVFSGIGNHQTFVSMIKKYGFKIIEDIEYPDHYNYTTEDIENILVRSTNLQSKIITTEKDYLRLGQKKTFKIKFIQSYLKISDEAKLINTITQ